MPAQSVSEYIRRRLDNLLVDYDKAVSRGCAARGSLVECGQGGRPCLANLDQGAARFESAADQSAVDGAQTGEEYAHALDRAIFGVGAIRRAWLDNRNLEPEAAADALAAVKADSSVHQSDELLRDRKPKPGAPKATRDRAVGLAELGEHSRFGRLGDADTRIDHLESDHRPAFVRCAKQRQRDRPLGGELDGVAHQIDQNLA